MRSRLLRSVFPTNKEYLDRECTFSHVTKVRSGPGILCLLEIPNVVIYSDGLTVYHVWDRKLLGSRIGGSLHIGRLSLETLEELLTSLTRAGVFRIEVTSYGGDAPFYLVSAKFRGEEASVVLAPWLEIPHEEELVKFVKELLILREWANQETGFQEEGKFDPPNIRLRTAEPFGAAKTDWPLSAIALRDGLIVSGERSKVVRDLIPPGWFREYRDQENDYIVGYVPQYPDGWP